MAGIFISYRRDDNRYAAGRLADELAGEFGPEHLFRDIESIAPGQDFEVALNTALASCAVMLVVIGPHWLDITDAQGRRRLEQDGDWVRTEVATALQRGIPVIPVLLQGTVLPRAEQLPADLQALTKRRFLELADTRWPRDMEVLVDALLKVPGLKRQAARPPAPKPPVKAAPKKKASPARSPSAGVAAPASPATPDTRATTSSGGRWSGALTVLGVAIVLVGLNWSSLRELWAQAPEQPQAAPGVVLPKPAAPQAAASGVYAKIGTTVVPLRVGEPITALASGTPAASSTLAGTWAWRKSEGELYTVVLRQQGERLEGQLLQAGQSAGSVTGSYAGAVATVAVKRHLALSLYDRGECQLRADAQAAALSGPCLWNGRQEDTRWTRAVR